MPGPITNKVLQRNVLIAVCTALMAVIASVSGLNVAQQNLAIDLGASQNAILWIINGYKEMSGTSMAAPHVTGLVAQLCDCLLYTSRCV